MCRRYSQRPSDVIGGMDRWVAFDFDIAMAAVHRKEDESQAASLAEANPMAGLLMLMSLG